MVSNHAYAALPTTSSSNSEASFSNTSPFSSGPSSPRHQPYPATTKLYDGLEEEEEKGGPPAWLDGSMVPTGRERNGVVKAIRDQVAKSKTYILIALCLVLSLLLVYDRATQRHVSATSTSATPTSAPLSDVGANLTSLSSPQPNTIQAEPAQTPPYRLENDLVLITKVGSATVHSRLPLHLALSTQRYIPNHLYVSDYPLTLPNPSPANASGEIELWDALSNVSSTIASLPEFKSLRGELKALIESNQDLAQMSEKDGGWKLDKYKFLPMVAEAWRRWPGRKWYVVVEADTFLFYPQLVRWLATLDPTQQLLMGHPSFTDYAGKSTMFTHGGSGIVISRALMEASFGADAGFEHHHDALMQESAFGDALLSKALYDAPGVELTEVSTEVAGERFNSDPPRKLKFTRGNWCEDVLTFHHVTGTDVAALYDFERRFEANRLAKGEEGEGKGGMVKWADIWQEFMPAFVKSAISKIDASTPSSVSGETLATQLHEAPAAGDKRDPDERREEKGEVGELNWQAFEEWDSETTDVSTATAEDCQLECRRNPQCLMWEWRRSQHQWGGGKRRREERRAGGRLKPLAESQEGEAEGGGKCRWTSEFVRIGVTKPHAKDGLTTGWMGARIKRWGAERGYSVTSTRSMSST